MTLRAWIAVHGGTVPLVVLLLATAASVALADTRLDSLLVVDFTESVPAGLLLPIAAAIAVQQAALPDVQPHDYAVSRRLHGPRLAWVSALVAAALAAAAAGPALTSSLTLAPILRNSVFFTGFGLVAVWLLPRLGWLPLLLLGASMLVFGQSTGRLTDPVSDWSFPLSSQTAPWQWLVSLGVLFVGMGLNTAAEPLRVAG